MGRVNISVTENSQTVNITVLESSISADLMATLDDYVQAGSIALLTGTRTIPLKKTLINNHYDVKCDGYITGQVGKVDIIVVSKGTSSFVVHVPEDCTVVWSITKY